MDNNKDWDIMINFIEKSEENDGIIKNNDGRIGKLEIHDKGILIKCKNIEKIYLSSEPMSNIQNDGWIINNEY